MAVLLSSVALGTATPPRCRDLATGWRFTLAASEAAVAPDFDDRAWRLVTVPHDWSIAAAPDPNLEGCTAYRPGGMGWYRCPVALTPAPGRVAYLCFDGVYNRATVWCNGRMLGFHPYGYSPFAYDVTDALAADGDNVLALRVDRTRVADSRWYPGAGITRPVTLVTAPRLHIVPWGTWVRTSEVTDEAATVVVTVTLRNAGATDAGYTWECLLVDPHGAVAATGRTAGRLAAGGRRDVTQRLVLNRPQRWDTDRPVLYRAVQRLQRDGQPVDTTVTRFGVRCFNFDAEGGFRLNGRPLRIRGVCLHHDGGCVGAAVPPAVWRRRLLRLQAAGCNAIRTAHNPPDPAFLDLCDALGLLVQEEFYDEWDYPKDKRLNCQERHDDRASRGHAEFFADWAERDLKATVRRDRNHPCIVQWSIGNEIEWTYPRYRQATGYFDADWRGNYFWTPPRFDPNTMRARFEALPAPAHPCAETARRLAAWTRQMDPDRPVTANCILPSASLVSGYADALDVVGTSYRRVVYDYAHRHFPDKPILGTENLPQWHEWRAVWERPFVGGVFLWTGIDYLGEAHDGWPRKGTGSGLLDLAGFPKPAYHLFRTLWNARPYVALLTETLEASAYALDPKTGHLVERQPGAWQRRVWSWPDLQRHWNYETDEPIVVAILTNADRAELRLGGRSLGVRSLSDAPDRVLRWVVPFRPGTLEARVVVGERTLTDRLVTAGPPTALHLGVDRSVLRSDGRDTAHVTAQLVDAGGRAVRHTERELRFAVEGAGRPLGVDNGAVDSTQSYQSDRVRTRGGRALLLVQAGHAGGTIRVAASGVSLAGDAVVVTTAPQAEAYRSCP